MSTSVVGIHFSKWLILFLILKWTEEINALAFGSRNINISTNPPLAGFSADGKRLVWKDLSLSSTFAKVLHRQSVSQGLI